MGNLLRNTYLRLREISNKFERRPYTLVELEILENEIEEIRTDYFTKTGVQLDVGLGVVEGSRCGVIHKNELTKEITGQRRIEAEKIASRYLGLPFTNDLIYALTYEIYGLLTEHEREVYQIVIDFNPKYHNMLSIYLEKRTKDAD